MPNNSLRNCSWFTRFASASSRATGSSYAFVAAFGLIILWAASYPVFSDFNTWQLVINTTTTIVTFLMVFLIQNSQNRDSEAVHIKLDELIRSIDGANNALLNIEDLDSKELDQLRREYLDLAEKATKELRDRLDTGGSDAR